MTEVTIPNQAGQGLNPDELKLFARWVVNGDKVDVDYDEVTGNHYVNWVTMRQWWEEQGRPEPAPPSPFENP